jgi:hypothetical protein
MFRPLAPICLALALLGASGTRADPGRFQDYVVGARALGLGGAFTALSDDASGIFYNPAGIVDVGRARLSISTNLYGLELRGQDVADSVASRLARGVSAADLIIIPSATGAVTGLGETLPSGHRRHAVAVGTQVPRYTARYVDTILQRPAGQGGPSEALLRSRYVERELHAGAAYAFRASPWLRVGAAMHYVLQTLDADESLQAPVSGTETTTFLLTENSLRATRHSARVVFGAKLRPSPRWSFGVMAAPPSLGVWRSVDFEASTLDGLMPGTDARLLRATADVSTLDIASTLPAQLRVGGAFQQPGEYTFSVDVVAYAPTGYSLLRPGEIGGSGEAGLGRIPAPVDFSTGPLVNANMGFELLIASDVSLAIGGFTNFSAAVADAPVDDLLPSSARPTEVDMFGASLALGFFGDHSLHRLGVTGSFGAGKVTVPDPFSQDSLGQPVFSAVDETQAFLYVFWSSSFRYGEGRSRRDLSM